jgi:choline-sulfatase
MPVIGFIDPRSPGTVEYLFRAFRQGLKDTGYVEGENVTIIYRLAEGQFDLLGLVRDEDMPKRGGSYKMARMAGPGESMYTTYDREIAARAQVWLREEAGRHTAKPWIMFLSFVCPHFPLTASAGTFLPLL